jgi:quercetin dioxygenase-like cupin family protein
MDPKFSLGESTSSDGGTPRSIHGRRIGENRLAFPGAQHDAAGVSGVASPGHSEQPNGGTVMKRVMVAIVAVAALAAGAAVMLRAQDAAKVDAKHYSVVLENDQVRVLRVQYGPGEKSVMHSHPDAVAVFLSDATGKFTFPDGTTKDIRRKAGDVMWNDALTHLPENTGDKPFEVIVVELKKPAAK